MGKADPTLPLPGDEAVQLGIPYKVTAVQDFVSEVQGFSGYRVILDGGEGNQIAIPLWYREIAGRRSKLGAFMVALGEDIPEWTGKKIVFVNWQDRERVIEAVK